MTGFAIIPTSQGFYASFYGARRGDSKPVPRRFPT